MTTDKILNADIVGSVASALCAIHCMATPFLFVAQTTVGESCEHISPLWWSAIDYVFIVITFFAVHHSSKHSSKPWMPKALYTLWAILTIFVLNEKAGLLPLHGLFKYCSAALLISFHLYNLKFCQCTDDGCCVA